MKRLLPCLFLLSSLAHGDTLLEKMSQPDKIGHYAWGATITAVGSIFATPETGLAATVVAALAKEEYDRRHPETHRVEKADAGATILGGLIVYAALKTEKLRLSFTPAGTPTLNYAWMTR